MGARPYDPTLGRFLAADPIIGGALNDYDYAGQDPITNFDLDGQAMPGFVFGDGGPRCVWGRCRQDVAPVWSGPGLSAGTVELVLGVATAVCVVATSGGCTIPAAGVFLGAIAKSAHDNGIFGGKKRNVTGFAVDVVSLAVLRGAGRFANRAFSERYVLDPTDRKVFRRTVHAMLESFEYPRGRFVP